MSTVGNSLTSATGVFGGTRLSNLYRGGTQVPNYGVYSAIASAGALALSQLQGVVYPIATFPSPYDPSISTATGGTATLTVDNTGGYSGTNAGSGTWKLYGAASAYDVRFTKTTGTTPTGSSVNTWLNLASTQSWSLNQPSGGPGVKSCSGTLDIRDSTSGTIVATSSVSITAEDFS